MFKRISRCLHASFSINNLSDKLVQLRAKYSEGHKLHDYQYSSLIEDMLKKKQSLSAYNILIQSYLDNVLIDKQIFNKIESRLGELEDSYKDVLNKMHQKHFLINNNPNKEHAKQESASKVNRQALQQHIGQTTKRLFKQGEILMGQIFTKTDLQKVVLKNVKINFDYEWINNLSNLAQQEQNQIESRKDQQLDDNQQISSQEDSNDDESLTIEDILRSIKSIEIGQVQISTKKND